MWLPGSHSWSQAAGYDLSSVECLQQPSDTLTYTPVQPLLTCSPRGPRSPGRFSSWENGLDAGAQELPGRQDGWESPHNELIQWNLLDAVEGGRTQGH